MTRNSTPRGILWRGDLAAALLSGDHETAAWIAERLGLVRMPSRTIEALPIDIAATVPPPGPPAIGDVDDATDYPANLVESQFWQPVRYAARTRLPAPTAEAGWGWTSPPTSPPQPSAMSAPSVVHPRLRKSIASLAPGRRIDTPKLVRRLANCEFPARLPRKRQRRWESRLVVVVDASERLTPFFEDQESLVAQLAARIPHGTIQRLHTVDPDDGFTYLNHRHEIADWDFHFPARVLILSDLGILQRGDAGRLQQRWHRWGKRLIRHGFSLSALVPVSVAAASNDLRRVFDLVPWQRSSAQFIHDAAIRQSLVNQLLGAVSPTVRLEPGLLRAIRLLIPVANDASLESDVWQHPMVTSGNPTAATLDHAAMQQRYCREFAALPQKQRQELLCTIRAWRCAFRDAPEVWFQELLNLDTDSQRLLEERFPDDVRDAIRAIHHLAHIAKQPSDTNHSLRVREYGGRLADWLSERACNDDRIKQPVHDLFDAAPRKQKRDRGGIDPALLGGTGEIRMITLRQSGESLDLVQEERHTGAPVTSLRTRNGWVSVSTPPADKNAFWKTGSPPSWATDWGKDEFGAWASFGVKFEEKAWPRTEFNLNRKSKKRQVLQRMRWIPPGEFSMGSPADGYDNSGPRRLVKLTRGFWLFDTPVTQELWEAVMGKNPSRFQGARRPLESVSWDYCQDFVKRMGEKLDGLSVSLPTEAQWEYACRAGTDTLYSFGDDSANLAEYAWYGENSDDETHEVGQRRPNAWGLYDMHGNVWEWCQDFLYENYAMIEDDDPTQPPEGLNRVLRGGSWNGGARLLRSTARSHGHPDDRLDNIGFRCAAVQAAVEPAEEDGQVAEPPASPTTGGEAAALKIEFGVTPHIKLPRARVVVIRSDIDELELRRSAKPTWASAMGRDRYGLWVELRLDTESKVTSSSTPGVYFEELQSGVTQRMRWVPPGRFLMGSPEGEVGRFADEDPQHEVTLTRGFWLFDIPVTQDLWATVMGENPSRSKGGRRPVENVSWEDCLEFAKSLSDRFQGVSVSLPAEAQWEYACRAGTDTSYSFGDDPVNLAECAWYNENSGGETHDVAQKRPNAWGLYDMHGNVLEWCHDYWSDNYASAKSVDPTGPPEGSSRVLRGGSRRDYARGVRSAYRYSARPDYQFGSVGFRCAVVQAGSEQASASIPRPL